MNKSRRVNSKNYLIVDPIQIEYSNIKSPTKYQKSPQKRISPELLRMMLLNTNSIEEFDIISRLCIGNKILKSICNEPDILNHYYSTDDFKISGFNWPKFTRLFHQMVNSKNPNQSTKKLLELNIMVYMFICPLDPIIIENFRKESKKWIKNTYLINGRSNKLVKQLNFIFNKIFPCQYDY
jgi:hypothetical protein